MEACSYQNNSPIKFLADQEKEKKDKYLCPCQEQQEDFTPMVYSVNGIGGREARGAKKRLASYLAIKWGWPYSQMVHYVRVWMAITVVCSNSLLLWGSCNQDIRGTQPLVESGAALHCVQSWRD